MLYLNRKRGEQIKIGDDITIEVDSITEDGVEVFGTVKIGIDAPRELQIDRPEWKEKQP